MNAIPVVGLGRYTPLSSRTIFLETGSLLSVNGSKAPVLRSASALQLALNLFDLRSIICSDGDFTGENYVKHVDECVSWDVCQFPEHSKSLE